MRMWRVAAITLYMALGLLSTTSIGLAGPPDTGQMLNQQSSSSPRLPDRLPQKDEPSSQQPVLNDSGVMVTVKGFRFSGGEGLATEAELQAVLADRIGASLDFAQIKGLADRITHYLRDRQGYLLARAYLPQQDISEGIIEIAIVAGRIQGKVNINAKPPRRINQSLLEGIADRAVAPQGAVRLADLERAVLLMNDLPGISARASLTKGADPGTTHVDIDVHEGPLLNGLVSGDNFGDRYTGAWRGTGQFNVNDPFGLGDRINGSFTGAERMAQGSIAYALPLGATGLTWSLAYNKLYYELGKEFADLDAEGRADTFSSSLGYPILRTRNASVWAGMAVDHLMLRDEAAGETTNDRRLTAWHADLSGNLYDGLGGGGLNSASLTLTCGKLDFEGVPLAEAADDAGPRSAGDFSRASYSLARLQRINRQISLFSAIRGQFAGDNLDSSQKFILGGPTGVRAYPVGEAPGDEGHAMTVEARFDLPDLIPGAALQLIGFADAGWIRLHKNPWQGAITNATDSNRYWLYGAGGGLSLSSHGRFSARLSYAHKIDDNPGRDADGNDADNRSDDGRFWLQAVVWF